MTVLGKRVRGGMLFFILILPSLLNGQNFLDMPEGISYDTVERAYYVSCWNPACVVKIDSLGHQSIFTSGLTACANNILVDSILYVSYRYGIRGYNIRNGNQVFYKSITENNYFDGIAFHDNYLYLINHGKKLYKIDIVGGTHELLASSGLGNYPQGLIYDEVNGRLLTCSFQNSSPIVSIDPETGQTAYALWTGLNNLDAMAQDQHGNIYITCNGTNSVYRYDSNLENRIVVSSGHSGPSGLEYNRDDNILAVSNFFTDIVDFVSMVPFSADDPINKTMQLDHIFPNPIKETTTVLFTLNKPSNIVLSLYDSRGRYIATLLDDHYQIGAHHFFFDIRDCTKSEICSGIYFVHISDNEQEILKEISVIR